LPCATDQLKRKLRQLKKLELRIRFKDQPIIGTQKLVWDVFFSTKTNNSSVKYSLPSLLKLRREEFKAIVEEYFYRLYFQNFQENGLKVVDVYDPQLLSLLGLPAYAGIVGIKARFRELAKRYHPDHGGDSEKFIELMGIYERLQK
jgi:hypothetical protein